MADSLRRLEGAYSLVMLTPDRVFAARDPRGFRPLVMGRISGQAAHRADTVVFASETCAFDLIGATYEREVKPGELVIVGTGGSAFALLLGAAAAIELHLRARLFLAARQHGLRPCRYSSRATPWDAQLALESPVDGRHRGSGA